MHLPSGNDVWLRDLIIFLWSIIMYDDLEQIVLKYLYILHFMEAFLCPLLLTWIDLIPAWISNHMLSKVWHRITYPFLNFMVAPFKFENG